MLLIKKLLPGWTRFIIYFFVLPIAWLDKELMLMEWNSWQYEKRHAIQQRLREENRQAIKEVHSLISIFHRKWLKPEGKRLMSALIYDTNGLSLAGRAIRAFRRDHTSEHIEQAYGRLKITVYFPSNYRYMDDSEFLTFILRRQDGRWRIVRITC